MTMPSVQHLYTSYHDKGFTVMAITDDDRSTVEKFLKVEPIHYPIYLDGLGEAQREFDVTNIPLAILIGKDGQVLDKFEGAPLNITKLEKEVQEALKQ